MVQIWLTVTWMHEQHSSYEFLVQQSMIYHFQVLHPQLLSDQFPFYPSVLQEMLSKDLPPGYLWFLHVYSEGLVLSNDFKKAYKIILKEKI